MRADKSLSPFEIRVYRHYRIVHGTRVALAFLLTFLIIRLFTIPESTWLLVTMVVIMGPISFWGNVVPRAFERIGVDFRSYRSATGVNLVTADVSLVRGGYVSLRLAGTGQETVSRIIDWGDAGNCCGFPDR
ncbi:inner membrane protein [Klebsiella pneumoniae]|nr:inner membrane protein [Klebsiella pneumoniae]